MTAFWVVHVVVVDMKSAKKFMRSMALVLVMGLAMTVSAPKTAEACCGCDVTDNDVAAANMTIARLRAHISREHRTTRRRLADFENGLMNFLNDWWDNRFRPSLEDMTEHWSTQLIQHAATWGTFFDASNHTDVMLTMQQNKLRTHRRYRPSDIGCQVTTTQTGLVRGHFISKATRAIMDRQQIARAANNVNWGNRLDISRNMDTKFLWEDFIENFCNEDANFNGMPTGCNDALMRDGDILPSKALLENETIDTEDELKTALAFIRNLAYMRPYDPMNLNSLRSSTGKDAFLERRSILARRNVVEAILHKMLGDRMPVNDTYDEMRDLVEQVGVPPSMISDNPSYFEMMSALTKKRFWDPQYFARLQNDPESLAREEATLTAFTLMTRRDIFHKLEEIAMLLAVREGIYLER